MTEQTPAGPHLPPTTDTVAELAPGEAQARARDAWRQSGGTLTGAELGERFGYSERWGRKQIAAARAANGTTGTPDRNGTSGTNGTVPAGAARTTGTGAGTAQRNARTPSGTPAGTSATPARRTGTARSRAASGRAPLALVIATVVAVVLVTVVCAVASYVHIRDLALLVGMGALAYWLPLALDGLVVACSCSLIVDRHRGRRGEAVAMVGVAVGLVGSLAANVLAVDPTWLSERTIRLVLAVMPPVALAVSGHLLLRMLGDRH